MREVIPECPVCNNNVFIDRYEVKDYLVSGEEFKIMSCKNCGLHFTNPRPLEDNINEYYDSVNYISHTDEAEGLINTIYKKVRDFTVKKKVNLIFNLNKKKAGKLLDVGCGSGFFLSNAKTAGWKTLGVEPDEKTRVSVQQKGIDVLPLSNLSEIESDSFDVITLWHVLEHTHFPNKTLNELKRILKPNGSLIIAVPNRLSFDAKYYKNYWAAFDVPRHLFHFSKKNIFQLAENAGLKVNQIKPMLFDAYYVSLISEKHKKGYLLTAIIVGALSNFIGWFKKEYSSHIYILNYHKE
jgi:2-polyprenyl-3-methyl-5-hydroxy-6-metoxy-1,4-benzoquinol methylase